MKIICSRYGEEKGLNEYVAGRIERTCPDCKGKGYDDKILNLGSPVICKRCHGDGRLTNQIRFNKFAPGCASNMFQLGSWLSVSYKPSLDFAWDKPIVVMVVDVMAEWLNSENGKYTHVCKCCKNKTTNPRIIACGKCGQEQIPCRDIDLFSGQFSQLAPLTMGLIECEVEILK